MNISPITKFNPSLSHSGSKKSFSGPSPSAESSDSLIETNRTIGEVGSLCLSGAVGLLAAGITASLTEGRTKSAIAGSIAAVAIGIFSWPSKIPSADK